MSKNTKAPSDETTTFSPASMALGIMIVGASAGLVLYTKRTRQLLTQIDRAQASQNTRKGINPEEYVNMKKRISKEGQKQDDLI